MHCEGGAIRRVSNKEGTWTPACRSLSGNVLPTPRIGVAGLASSGWLCIALPWLLNGGGMMQQFLQRG